MKFVAAEGKVIEFRVGVPPTVDPPVIVSIINVPEPSTLLLFGLGMWGFVGMRKWRRKKKRGKKRKLMLLVLMAIIGITPLASAQVFVDSGQRLGSSNSYDVDFGDLDGDGDLDAFIVNSNEMSPT